MAKLEKSRLPARDAQGNACEVIGYTMSTPEHMGGLKWEKQTPWFYELEDGTSITPVEGEQGVYTTPDARRITLADPDRV